MVIQNEVREGTEWTEIVRRIEGGITTEADARVVEQLVRDQQELVTGVRSLAQKGLAALVKGTWQTTRENLERLVTTG